MHSNHLVFPRSILPHYHHLLVFLVVKIIQQHRSVISREPPLDIHNFQLIHSISSMHICHPHLLHQHLHFNHLYHWKVMIQSVRQINSTNQSMFGHHKQIIFTKQINRQHHSMIILYSTLQIMTQQSSNNSPSPRSQMTVYFPNPVVCLIHLLDQTCLSVCMCVCACFSLIHFH